MPIKLSIQERFWNKVKKSDNPDDCWIWIASKLKSGYGMFGYYKGPRPVRSILAHRVSYALHHNLKLENIADLYILHRCDNPSCVRPNHLFSGSQKDNIDDMISKGRKVVLVGEAISKLREHEVLEIKRLLKEKTKISVIARQFKVGEATIHSIKTGNTWKWLRV